MSKENLPAVKPGTLSLLTDNKPVVVTITKVYNETQKKDALSPEELSKFQSNSFNGSIESDTIDSPATMPAATDQISVTWGTRTADFYRASGGKMTYANGKLKISELQENGITSASVRGTILMGKSVARIRIGNRNSRRETIIDLSDKDPETGKGTVIDVPDLINWITNEADGGEVKLPEGADVSGFKVEFKDCYLNLGTKRFKFNVESEKSQELKVGKFRITNVGLVFTNEPLTEEELKALE